MKLIPAKVSPKPIPQTELIKTLTRIDAIASQEIIASEQCDELRLLYTHTLQWIDLNHTRLDPSQNYQLIEFLYYYSQVV